MDGTESFSTDIIFTVLKYCHNIITIQKNTKQKIMTKLKVRQTPSDNFRINDFKIGYENAKVCEKSPDYRFKPLE